MALNSFQEMLANVEQLMQQRDAAKNELEMARDTARTYYQKMEDCDRFVLVLIDGDSMPFVDAFVSRGLQGGEDAAKHLRAALLDYLKKTPRYHADDRIVIRVYANCRGLAKTYRAAKIIPDESVFEQFMIGFNNSHPLSDHIDAGNRKEAADSKLKANFELFYRNFHCQHVVFGGSADSSYAGFLSPFASPTAVNDRITLLEGPAFPNDLKKVAQGFRQTSFPDIFRTAKLQVIPNGSIAVTAGLKRPAAEPLTAARERQPAPLTTPIATLAKAQALPVPSQLPVPPVLSPTIFQNQYGQRLDPPLNYDRKYLQHLYDYNSKLCNNFYLKGHCPYGNTCEWDHSQVLNQLQLDTLRHKARTSACRNAFCTDPQCPLGHMCPRNGTCNISQCKFLPEMHHIDTSQVYEVNTATGERKKVSVPA
ncbi:CCCH zinc finger DNA binding protein [Cladophialophora carrionii]|uniref:CCCH zinc finger DNA binding protein n=1 Tax=Cladophialophora carrionii TaxID=86049 RepID=A0A1C1CZ88_9EURO|nr:CCCH zinc finger DNA binding protein [Cladophialophora carrionii]